VGKVLRKKTLTISSGHKVVVKKCLPTARKNEEKKVKQVAGKKVKEGDDRLVSAWKESGLVKEVAFARQRKSQSVGAEERHPSNHELEGGRGPERKPAVRMDRHSEVRKNRAAKGKNEKARRPGRPCEEAPSSRKRNIGMA